jgi:hypothetical protein
MRLIALAILLCGLCESASAQAPECKSIANPGLRLACYDKASPPVASAPVAAPAVRSAPASKVDGSKYVDTIGAEEALVSQKIKNICRGC